MKTQQHIGLLLLLMVVGLTTKKLAAQDSMYVKSYGNILSTKGFIYNNTFNLKDNNTGLDYIPDGHTGVGIGVWCKYFPFDICIRQEMAHVGSKNFKQNKTTDMQLKGYNSFFAGDIYIQKYTGFVELNSTLDAKTDIELGNMQPNLSVFHYGMVGQYIFNGQKFSYRAGFTQNEMQLQSSGSLLLGAAFYYLKLKSEHTLFKDTVASLTSFNTGANVGYAYNLVIGQHMLLFASAVFGINRSGNTIKKMLLPNQADYAPVFHFKGAFWYAKQKWSVGVTVAWNSIMQTFNKNYNLYLNNGRSELIYMRRLWFKDKSKIKNQNANEIN